MKRKSMFCLIFVLIVATLIVATYALYGDIYNDNVVNSKDAVRLAQYLAIWDIDFSENDKKNADVYYDGVINAKDAVKLAQYLAGWDVKLGPRGQDIEVGADSIFGHPTDTAIPPETIEPPADEPTADQGKLYSKLGLGETVSTDGKIKQAKVLSGTAEYVFSSNDIKSCSTGDIILFTFIMKADKSTKITITPELGTSINYKDNSKSIEYTVPAQWTKFYLPVENNGMESIALSTDGEVYVGVADFENLGAADITSQELQLKSGMWIVDDFETVSLTTGDGISAGPAIAIVRSGDYIYSIGDKKFTVSSAKTRKVVATLGGFGTLRQMGITDDGKHAIITGRHDGLYIVSVENPESPKIVSSYNTIEQATGLYVSGDYAFIGNRTFGIEIVDISDPANPVHRGNIRSGEVQSCAVHDNIVYAGIWGECGVFMYDLTQLDNTPVLERIGFFNTNGKGDGLSVVERDGKLYVFAATGHHLYDASYTDSPQNLAYGQGNGMDIFDVTDPANPKWIATTKIDGRYYYQSNDYWETEVSYDAKTGKWYAYLINTYNGVFVYDVTDFSAPIRLTHITIDHAAGSSPALVNTQRTILTAWDQLKTKRGPVGALVVGNGQLFIAGTDSDVFIVDTPYAIANEESSSDETKVEVGEHFYSFTNKLTGGKISSFKEGGYTHIATTGQTFAAAVNGNYLYVAAGAEGILIYDNTTFEKVGSVTPSTENGRVGFALDVKIYDGKLYAAEDVSGLRVYDITGSNAAVPKLLSVYNESTIVTQVTIASDGGFAVLHMGNSSVRLVNLSTMKKANFIINETGKTVDSVYASLMYHHNLSPLIADRYVVFWTHTGTEYWLDFGPAGSRYTIPQIVSTGGANAGAYKSKLSLNNGITSYEKDGVHYAIRVETKAVGLQSDFTSNASETLFKTTLAAKPAVIGDYLVLTHRQDGLIAFYKMDGTYLGTLKVNGNPDGAYGDNGKIYIPLGYQGLLVVDTATTFG